MHVDPEAAKRGRFGGLIASGWHTGGDDDAAPRRQFSAEGRRASPRPASTNCAGCTRFDPGDVLRIRVTRARSDALAFKTRPRHGAHPDRGAEPGRKCRHEPEADEHHRAPEQSLKIGIVSDVHCNHAGLLQALELLGDVDELICLGDSIYEYRFSNEVVAPAEGPRRHHDPRQPRGGFSRPAWRPRAPAGVDRPLAAAVARRAAEAARTRCRRKEAARSSTRPPGSRTGLTSIRTSSPVGAVRRRRSGFRAVRPHPPSAGAPRRQGTGDQPGLGRRSTRPRQRPAIELRRARHGHRRSRGDRFPGTRVSPR